MESTAVVVGIDTHGAFHHAAALDQVGRRVGDREFPATEAGYAAMLRWMQSLGDVESVGVEGTGSYGAGLARHLHRASVRVLEVPRPDRRARRQYGKSDPIDAEAAARAVLDGSRATQPKIADGAIESIRMLRVAKLGAIKANTAAINTLRAVATTAPESLRSDLSRLSKVQIVHSCRRLRPDMDRLDDPVQAALRTTCSGVCLLPFIRVPPCPLGLWWNPHIMWTRSRGSDQATRIDRSHPSESARDPDGVFRRRGSARSTQRNRELIDGGSLRPIVAATFDLGDARAAFSARFNPAGAARSSSGFRTEEHRPIL